MAYQGDSLIKKVLQTPFKAIGYKIVRLKPYEELSTPSRAETGFTKLFCIGFNKTATTTVEAVLREHGFRLPKQVDQEVLLRPVLDGQATTRLLVCVHPAAKLAHVVDET